MRTLRLSNRIVALGSPTVTAAGSATSDLELPTLFPIQRESNRVYRIAARVLLTSLSANKLLLQSSRLDIYVDTVLVLSTPLYAVGTGNANGAVAGGHFTFQDSDLPAGDLAITPTLVVDNSDGLTTALFIYGMEIVLQDFDAPSQEPMWDY